jgi:hypothetical protein
MSIESRSISTGKNNQNIVFGTVIDNKDPENAGRIRVLLDNNKYKVENFVAWRKGSTVNNTVTDPYICNPFLPKLINVVPKVGELVKVIFYNPDYPELDKEYVGPVISQFNSIEYENATQGRVFTQSQKTNLLPNLGNFEYSKGLLPDINNITILGRKSTDLTVKPNDVLIRSGKVDLKDNKKFNKKGSLFQISSNPVKLDRKTTPVTVNKRIPEPINNVVIYNLNSDNSGYVNVYKLTTPKNTSNININTNLTNLISAPAITYTFSANTQTIGISYINQFLSFLDNNQIKNQDTDSGIITINQPVVGVPYLLKPESLLPIYSTVKVFNVTQQGFRTIKPIENQLVDTLQENINTSVDYQNYMVALSDMLYFLSNETSIPEKGFINFDGINNGFTVDKVTREINDKTDPMVRGDQLVKALVIIINAFLNHVHSGFGFMSVNQTDEIQKLTKLRSELNGLILNHKIRIN